MARNRGSEDNQGKEMKLDEEMLLPAGQDMLCLSDQLEMVTMVILGLVVYVPLVMAAGHVTRRSEN